MVRNSRAISTKSWTISGSKWNRDSNDLKPTDQTTKNVMENNSLNTMNERNSSNESIIVAWFINKFISTLSQVMWFKHIKLNAI